MLEKSQLDTHELYKIDKYQVMKFDNAYKIEERVSAHAYVFTK